jgi:hypothetical protein
LDRALIQRDTLPEQHGSLVKTDHIRESFKFQRSSGSTARKFCQIDLNLPACNHSAGRGLALQVVMATTGTKCK